MKQKVKKQKTFKKGDQCVQNPTTNKFRNEVKRSVVTQRKTGGGLTLEALEKHNEIIDDDELGLGDLAISEKTGTTTKSKAFSISGLTDCSNITFSKVLDKWNSSNKLDREKCAILAAVTEVIRAKGGIESESEYFAALMTALEASNDQTSATAITYLLSLVIKRVPPNLLKAKFSEISKCFVQLLEKHSDEGKTSLVVCCLDCLSTTLLSQDPVVWTEPSTQRYFQVLLAFATHTKPKVRKLTHHAIKNLMNINLINHKNHPIGTAVTKYSVHMLAQHTNENATATHHILNMLKQSIHLLSPADLKEVCETVLRLLTINSPIMKSNAMQTLHALFIANPPEENLTVDLNAKLITALYDFQPSVNDSIITDAWLSLMMAAHSNLSLINEDVCLQILPKFFGTAMTFFTSEHRRVAASAADIMKQTSEKCLEPSMEKIVSDIQSKDSPFTKVFKLVESGLRYKYQPVWDIVLQSMQYLYDKFGKYCSSVMIDSVCSLIDLHQSPDFPYLTSLNKAIGAAIKSIGPELILKKRELELIRDDGVCEFPRAWLLPIMKESIQETELQFFIDSLLPVAAQLRKLSVKCRESKMDLEGKTYETLQTQIWSLLPGFCTNPTDLAVAFKNIAKILGTALMERSDLRPIVLQSLRTLINKTQDEAELKAIGGFAKNYMPILFNIYTSDDEDCQAISLSILETIKTFLIITEADLVSAFVKKLFEKMKEVMKIKKRHQLMDLAVCMVKYSDKEQVFRLYQLATENVQEKDKSMQKKAYRILEEMCDSNSEYCKELVQEKFDELKTMLVDSLSTAAPSSKAPRLRCISSIVKKLSKEHQAFLQTIIPEVILCTKEVGVKAKTAAFDLIVDIGNSYVFLSSLPKEDCIEQYFHCVMAGLAGSPHMISSTLLAFTKMIFEYRYCISYKLVATILDASIKLLKSTTREVVKSAVLFIRAVVKILDGNELTAHLETMIKNLFTWNTPTKSIYRVQIRRILEKLEKKCGYQLVKSFVPDPHKKFIIQIHKTTEREKKRRESKRNAPGIDEDFEERTTKPKETTWESILADSDDENEDGQGKKVSNKNNKSHTKHAKTWIMEGEDTVDLLDPTISKNIVATKPKMKRESKTKLDEFSLSADGKLMINDDDNEGGMNEEAPLDIGVKDMLGGFAKNPKQLKLGKRKRLEDMPENEGGGSEPYQPGGHGIHRRREEDDDGAQFKKKKFGEDYKSKKAGGDMKLKGKPDPFAYIPLDRQTLNKRKKAKLAGQYQNVVKAARKGAASGNKFRKTRK